MCSSEWEQAVQPLGGMWSDRYCCLSVCEIPRSVLRVQRHQGSSLSPSSWRSGPLCPCLSVESTIYYHVVQWLISPRIPLGPLHLRRDSVNLGYCGHKLWSTWGSPSLCFFSLLISLRWGRGSAMSWNRLWPPDPDNKSASASQVMELSFSLKERSHRYSRVFTKLFFSSYFYLF